MSKTLPARGPQKGFIPCGQGPELAQKAVMVLRLLLSLIFSLFLSSAALARGPVFDVVFDIDWTLFYPSKTQLTADSIQVGEDYYRLADGALEVIAKLHTEGHRVSLYSGGVEARNKALAEYLQEKLRTQGVRDFSFHKVLHFQDLKPRPGAPEGARFSERLMKDLSLVNADLNRVVLVDDMPKFSVPGQEKNMYFVGKTYAFHSHYDSAAHGEFDPPSKEEWRRERNKILHFYELFEASLKGAASAGVLDRLQVLREGPGLCSRAFSY